MGTDLRRLLADAAGSPSDAMDMGDVVRRGQAHRRRRAAARGGVLFIPLALLVGTLALSAGYVGEPLLVPAGPGPDRTSVTPEVPPPAPPEPQNHLDPVVAQATQGLGVLEAQLEPLQPVYPEALPPNVHLTGAYRDPAGGYRITLGEVHQVPAEDLPAGTEGMQRVGFTWVCAAPEGQAALMEEMCAGLAGERVERQASGWRLAIVLGAPLDATYPFTTFWTDVAWTSDPAPLAATAADVHGALQFPKGDATPTG